VSLKKRVGLFVLCDIYIKDILIMKHLLNNLSEEEKNNIREQHEGGMNLAIDNFKKLVETKSGDAKPFLSEQNTDAEEKQTRPFSDKKGMKLGPLKDDEIEDLAEKIVNCLNDEGKKLLFRLNSEEKEYKAFFDMAMTKMGKYINSFGPKGPLG